MKNTSYGRNELICGQVEVEDRGRVEFVRCAAN